VMVQAIGAATKSGDTIAAWTLFHVTSAGPSIRNSGTALPQ
jgi:hypothetical protein